MEPMAPDTPVPVTLQAQEWNALLGVLVEAPYKQVAGLIAQITEQAQRHAQQVGAQPPMTNGGISQHLAGGAS